MLSQINNIIQALYLPETILNNIDSLLFQFVWGGSNPNQKVAERVKRSTLCLPMEEGGLGMISIKHQQQVTSLKWIQGWEQSDTTTHSKILNKLFKHVGGIYFVSRCDTSTSNFQGLDKINSFFWKSALKAWLSLDKSGFNNTTKDIPLFNNNLFSRFNKPLFIPRWISLNILYHHQLVENGRVISFEKAKLKLGNYGGLIFDYLAVTNAIFKFNSSNLEEDSDSKLDFSSVKTLSNKIIRNIIVKQQLSNQELTCANFWERSLEIDISKYFSIAKQATGETKLRNMYFKILHNIYPTNLLLHRMKIKASPNCDYCGDIDHIIHMFFSCPSLKSFWESTTSLVQRILNDKISLGPIDIILGITKEEHGYSRKKIQETNHLLLVAKYCIIKKKSGSQANTNLDYILSFELLMREKYFPSLNLITT